MTWQFTIYVNSCKVKTFEEDKNFENSSFDTYLVWPWMPTSPFHSSAPGLVARGVCKAFKWYNTLICRGTYRRGFVQDIRLRALFVIPARCEVRIIRCGALRGSPRWSSEWSTRALPPLVGSVGSHGRDCNVTHTQLRPSALCLTIIGTQHINVSSYMHQPEPTSVWKSLDWWICYQWSYELNNSNWTLFIML